MKKAYLLLTAASLAALPVLASADPGDGGYGHHGMGWGGWLMGPLMMFLFVGLIVGGVLVVLRVLGIGDGRERPDGALEILKQRFAKGEIDREEFEERKSLLRS